jgi:hypothetical protein
MKWLHWGCGVRKVTWCRLDIPAEQENGAVLHEGK